MKNNVCFLLLLPGILACTAQNPASNVSLDGRTFQIETYTGGKLEGAEMMTFRNGMAENDECTKWGFGSGAYTSDNKGNFKYTLTSEQEDKMDWEGQVTGNSVSGTMVWVKAGQADIHYTFKGKEMKN